MNTQSQSIQQPYSRERTALLIVDPYNDFMSEGGKLYDATKEISDAVDFYNNMRKLISAVRSAGIQVFIVPHHRSRKDDFESWLFVTRTQAGSRASQMFAVDTWGGEWNPEFGPKPGDVIIKEHWAQSGFANTDLDQQLKQHGIQRIILIGVLANTCIESTGRFGMELGYHVTLVKDATTAFTAEGMHSAHEVNGPTFAHAMLTTAELMALLPEASGTVYELRVYHACPGKLSALMARFRDHTKGLFQKHSIKDIAYWTAMEGPEKEDTLIYLLEHRSRQSADLNWRALIDDPEWISVAALSEAEGKLVKQIDSTFLARAEFSPSLM